MSIMLDSITLNRDMIWLERHQAQSVAQSVRRTVGGAPVIYSGALLAGQRITLSAGEPNGVLIGVLKKSVVDAVLALAAVAGSQHTLTIDDATYNVIFRHDEPPAVEMSPLVAKTSYGANDLMRGSIKLLTI